MHVIMRHKIAVFVAVLIATLTAADAGRDVQGEAIFLAAAALYWLPTAVAAGRHARAGQVAVVNGFLGWTVLGWVVALAMALR